MSHSEEHSPSRAPSDTESGYASAASSSSSLPSISFTKPHLKYLNSTLSTQTPLEILHWATLTLPSLFQTTAFGLSGLVTLDLLSKLHTKYPTSPKIDLIFLDTLYHFRETLDLMDRLREKYPNVTIHVYKPEGLENAKQFELKHGERLWETNPDLYDYLAKVEPAERAYRELNVAAVLTGRRRSQGSKRSDLGVIEVDDAGLVKVNPMINWSFAQVQEYITQNEVPCNELLKKGYKSVGDWHSTQPVKEGEGEREGRWKGLGEQKTECGIHNRRSKYAVFLEEQERRRREEEIANALARSSVAVEVV